MSTINFSSNDLPEIHESIKTKINNGLWFLFTQKKKSESVFYYLIVGDQVYLLNKDGGVIEEKSKKECALDICDPVYFSDLPKPVSVSKINYNEIVQ